MSQTSSNPSNAQCSEESIPELIDLVEAHLHKRMNYWKQGIYIAELFSGGHCVDIWNRSAGILINNKWYGWAKPNVAIIPIHASDPKFFRQIVKDCRNAFVRSGEDVRWNRPFPLR